MAFVNEYVPPLEAEASEFLRAARAKLGTGHTTHDMWTVDRENDMVLCLNGVGTSLESQNHEYWSFIDRKGEYFAIVEVLARSEIAPGALAITRSIAFQRHPRWAVPDRETRACIKAALQEYKDLGAASIYKKVQLKLIDAFTGEEI
ncbi:hypothetical protein H8N03_19175 [Ramlibacter sp. USB13]|uniref:Uncharacterized protein n=1 Tax=Ramlibacter cellulosilyticus TaxID=2764187 RepID=A0A923MWL3_9BURK|nr:hypothetical protein [Ramlibacter cellulosilyticus]MBC5785077.1 hypothetical protein [Ramlibacter cellulosilyticus]